MDLKNIKGNKEDPKVRAGRLLQALEEKLDEFWNEFNTTQASPEEFKERVGEDLYNTINQYIDIADKYGDIIVLTTYVEQYHKMTGQRIEDLYGSE